MSIARTEIIKNSLPVALSYITLGLTFGALFSAKGGSPLEALIISVFCFAGAAQFIALEFYGNNFSFTYLFIAVFICNVRHVFYGLSFLQKWSGWKKIYLFSALTDENLGISYHYINRSLRENDWLMVYGLNHSYWIIGCVVGSLVPISNLDSIKGFSFALVAMFISILCNLLKQERTKDE
jgi:4-azaleucine resistance transporter AzlC